MDIGSALRVLVEMDRIFPSGCAGEGSYAPRPQLLAGGAVGFRARSDVIVVQAGATDAFAVYLRAVQPCIQFNAWNDFAEALNADQSPSAVRLAERPARDARP